jgi:hypothetical protein
MNQIKRKLSGMVREQDRKMLQIERLEQRNPAYRERRQACLAAMNQAVRLHRMKLREIYHYYFSDRR